MLQQSGGDMGASRLLLLLLLPPCPTHLGDALLEYRVETIKEESYETPACDNQKLHSISLVVCQIKMASGRGDECRLIYQTNSTSSWFEHIQCDSRFKLHTNDQSVTLHMSSLTPADSWNVSCFCSGRHSHVFGISLTVVEAPANRSSNSSAEEVALPSSVLVWPAAAAGLLVAVVMLGCLLLLLLLQRRNRAESPMNQPEMDCDDVQTYSTLLHTHSGLYSTLQIQPPTSTCVH